MPRNAQGMPGEAPRGFGLVDLAVALAVLAILLYFLLDRVLYMQEVAEKTEVEETVRSINYGLRLEAASRLARGPDPGRLALEKDNPVKWLNAPPRNYIGEHEKAPAHAKPGYWYYQLQSRQLIYRPNRAERLRVEGLKEKELRFDVRRNGVSSQPRLVPHPAYVWFDDRAGGNR
ncbi:MAG: hypothetical protein WC023_12870 [Rhodocyclaceae bacterium]